MNEWVSEWMNTKFVHGAWMPRPSAERNLCGLQARRHVCCVSLWGLCGGGIPRTAGPVPSPSCWETEAAGGLASSCGRHPSPAWPLCSPGPLGLWSQRTMVALWPLPHPLTVPVTHQGCWRPGPGTQRACPLIKRQTRSDRGPAGGGRWVHRWPFKWPNRRGLGLKMGQQEVVPGGLLQRPHPLPRTGPGESDGKGWVYSLLVWRRFLDGPTVWTDWRLPLYGWCVSSWDGVSLKQRFFRKKKKKQHFITLLLKSQAPPSAPGIKSQALHDLTSNPPSPLCSLCFAHLPDF